MRQWLKLRGQIAQAVVAAYDFSRFSTIVDVGGGSGALITAILAASKALRGIVFDLPIVGVTVMAHAADLNSAFVRSESAA
jgi:16S rRNA A1518/A1519 N6-dimethyltransferase RsmA/KsgA/DIM1 with predicted DNA glycosylase/AP lyase activity